MEMEQIRERMTEAIDELLTRIKDSYATSKGWSTARTYILGLMDSAERKMVGYYLLYFSSHSTKRNERPIIGHKINLDNFSPWSSLLTYPILYDTRAFAIII